MTPDPRAQKDSKYTTGRCPCCGGQRRVVNPQWLRDKRELEGLSMRELARRLGLSAAYLSDIERGHRHVTSRILKSYEEL